MAWSKDSHKNFGYSTIATAPSPALSGTSLVVQSSDGAKFDTTFNATIWPANVAPTKANAEIVRVTRSSDTFTITRAQEGSSARAIIVGDQVAETATTKTFTDIEDALTQKTIITAGSSAGNDYITDGTADNVQILSMVNDARANAQETYIHEGTYDWAAQSVVTTQQGNVTVSGAGLGKTILKRSFTGTGTMFHVGSGAGPTVASNVTVRDLTIDQNSTGSGWGLVTSWCKNVVLERISFINQNSTSLAALLVGRFSGSSDNFEANFIRVNHCLFDYSAASALGWEVVSCINARDVIFDGCRWVGIASSRPGLLLYNSEQGSVVNGFVDHARITFGGRGTYSVTNTRFEMGLLFFDQAKDIYVGGGTSFKEFGTTTSFSNGIQFKGGYKTGSDPETPWYVASLDFATTDVNTSTEVITLSDTTDFPTEASVQLTTTGTLPGGLSLATDYYVINVSATTIKLATSASNALSGTAIDLTSQGTGVHTVTVNTVFSCENVVIDGVIFRGAKANAVFSKTTTESGTEVLDTRDISIMNCKIDGCTGIPIIAFGETVKIIGNEIRNGNTNDSATTAYHIYVAGSDVTIENNFADSDNVDVDVVVDHARFTSHFPTMKLRIRNNNFSAATTVKYYDSGGILQTTPTSGVILTNVEDKVSTTNATVTTLSTINVPSTTTLSIKGYVSARRTGGSSGTAEDGAMYRVEAVYKNISGTATSIGSVVTVIGESQSGWDVTLSASSGTVLVRVTGAANNNITWRSDLEVDEVSS